MNGKTTSISYANKYEKERKYKIKKYITGQNKSDKRVTSNSNCDNKCQSFTQHCKSTNPSDPVRKSKVTICNVKMII